MSPASLLLILAAAQASPASADEAADREAAMFGTDEAEPTETEVGTESRLLDRLGETQDTLAVGGQLYLRYTASRSGIEGEGLDETDDDTAAPALLDVYLDARPNDRLRSYSRVRLSHQAIRDRTDWALDQLWLKFDLGRTVFATVGRQHIKWGVGRIWNPTDFLMDVRDPLAVFDERVGRNFLKLHLPIESLGWNLYGVGEVVPDDDGAHKPGGALRAELLLGTAEIALAGYKREDGPWRAGADLSAGLGPIDIRGEIATDGDSRDLRMVGGVEVPFNYSDEDSATVGVEYLRNERPEVFSPLYRGQNAVGGYLVLMAPGSWNDTTVIANYIRNLTEGDWTARLDWQVRVLTYLRVNVYGQRSEAFDFALGGTSVSIDANASEAGVGFTLGL